MPLFWKPTVLNELLPELDAAPEPLVMLLAPDVLTRLLLKVVAARVVYGPVPVKSQPAIWLKAVPQQNSRDSKHIKNDFSPNAQRNIVAILGYSYVTYTASIIISCNITECYINGVLGLC